MTCVAVFVLQRFRQKREKIYNQARRLPFLPSQHVDVSVIFRTCPSFVARLLFNLGFVSFVPASLP